MFRTSATCTSLPLARMLVVAVVTSGALIASSGQAFAHSELIETNPAEGAQLHKAPSQVRLTFGEDVQQQGNNGIIVTGPGNTRYSDAPSLQIDGTIASIELTDDQVSGTYTVAYRIVSADGHVVEGAYTYQLNLSASTPSPDQSTTTPSPDISPAVARQSPDEGSGWMLGFIAIGLALVAAMTAVALRRRRG